MNRPNRAGRRGSRSFHRYAAAFSLFLATAAVLAGCATTPFPPRSPVTPGAPGSAVVPGAADAPDTGSPPAAPVARNPITRSFVDNISTPAGEVTLEAFVLRPDATVTLVTPERPAPGNAVILLTNPWRRPGRTPVGVVYDGSRLLSPPEPPYWAIAVTDRLSSARVLPQAGLSPPPAGHIVVGGFYPLILEGRVVTAAFPGTAIRAARVVVAGRDGTRGDDEGATEGEGNQPITIVTAEGSRPFSPGPTNAEVADYLLRRGYRWAINMDGGRSATVVLPDDTVVPRGILFRRPGPVGLALFVIP